MSIRGLFNSPSSSTASIPAAGERVGKKYAQEPVSGAKVASDQGAQLHLSQAAKLLSQKSVQTVQKQELKKEPVEAKKIQEPQVSRMLAEKVSIQGSEPNQSVVRPQVRSATNIPVAVGPKVVGGGTWDPKRGLDLSGSAPSASSAPSSKPSEASVPQKVSKTANVKVPLGVNTENLTTAGGSKVKSDADGFIALAKKIQPNPEMRSSDGGPGAVFTPIRKENIPPDVSLATGSSSVAERSGALVQAMRWYDQTLSATERQGAKESENIKGSSPVKGGRLNIEIK